MRASSCWTSLNKNELMSHLARSNSENFFFFHTNSTTWWGGRGDFGQRVKDYREKVSWKRNRRMSCLLQKHYYDIKAMFVLSGGI